MAISDAPPRHGKDYIRALEYGLAVLRAFDGSPAEMTLTEVAARASLGRQATRRLLITLEELGYIRRREHLFRVSPRVFDLGYTSLAGASVVELSSLHLKKLVREVGEPASLAVLDQGDIRFLAHVPIDRILGVAIRMGTRLPAPLTAMGHVLLAELSHGRVVDCLARFRDEYAPTYEALNITQLPKALLAVRSRGWAAVTNEIEIGNHTIAVPIRTRGAAPVAALGITVHASRCDAVGLEKRLLLPLQSAAALVESDFLLIRQLQLSG